MTRIILNEHLVDRFIVGLFNAVLTRKKKIIQKAMNADPEIKRIVLDIEKSRRELEEYVKNNSQDSITPFLTGLD